jgi:hypothetical protein
MSPAETVTLLTTSRRKLPESIKKGGHPIDTQSMNFFVTICIVSKKQKMQVLQWDIPAYFGTYSVITVVTSLG